MSDKVPAKATSGDVEVYKDFSPEDYGFKSGEIAPGTELAVKSKKWPFMRMIQDTSKEALLKEDDQMYLEPGSIVNSVTGEILGSKNVQFDVILLKYSITRVKFLKELPFTRLHFSTDGKHCHPSLPREDGIKLCSHCPDSKWRKNPTKPKDDPPICPEQGMYPSLIVGQENLGPVLLILSKTSFPQIKKINDRVTDTKIQLPYFAYVFSIRAEKHARGKFMFNCELKEQLDPTDVRFQIAKKWFTDLSDLELSTEDRDEEDPQTNGGTGKYF